MIAVMMFHLAHQHPGGLCPLFRRFSFRSNFGFVRGRTKCWHRGYAMWLHVTWAVRPRSLTLLRLVVLVC